MSQKRNVSSSRCRICPDNIFSLVCSLNKGFELRSRRTNLGSIINSSIKSNENEKLLQSRSRSDRFSSF